MTGIKTVNQNFRGKKLQFLSYFFIFSPFLTDFSESEGKINDFSLKTIHNLRITDGNKNSKKRTLDSPGSRSPLVKLEEGYCTAQDRERRKEINCLEGLRKAFYFVTETNVFFFNYFNISVFYQLGSPKYRN